MFIKLVATVVARATASDTGLILSKSFGFTTIGGGALIEDDASDAVATAGNSVKVLGENTLLTAVAASWSLAGEGRVCTDVPFVTDGTYKELFASVS